MLGRRKPQTSFFDVLGMPHPVSPGSFYGRMGSLSAQMFRDEDLAELYCADNGRSSLPPSLMCGVTLLQFFDDVSDGEAVERTKFDLRWKVALGLPLDYDGFDPSSLVVFRRRLLEGGQERYAFDRFVKVGRAAGFIPDRVSLLIDTTWAKGGGAVQDTYTLLRKGVRKLLRQIGFHLPGKRQGLAPEVQRLLATYLDQDRKADIDWHDPAERAAQLAVLVADCETALELAVEHSDNDDVRATGWLLTKILGDDVVRGTDGKPQIGEGTAPERIISLTDPEMRHGRKSSAHRFDGYKAVVSTDQASEMILDVGELAASEGDGKSLLPSVERVEQHTDVTVARALGDGAFGSGANRAACAEREQPVDLMSPMRQPVDPAVDKSAFEIDLEAQTATCPQGHIISASSVRQEQGRPVLHFVFPRQTCEACPLFERCVRSQTSGRTLTTSPFEAYLRAAQERQKTAEFKETYRLRSRVEGKQAEMVGHGLRNTRYVGAAKRQLQRLWLSAAVNLKRLFTLAEARQVDLPNVFGRLDLATV